MKTRLKDKISRLAASLGVFAVALGFAPQASAGEWGFNSATTEAGVDYYYTSTAANWGENGAQAYLRFDGKEGTVTWDDNKAASDYIWVGLYWNAATYNNGWLIWKAKDGSDDYGFTQSASWLTIADGTKDGGDAQEAHLKIESGTYSTGSGGLQLGSGIGVAELWQTGGSIIVNGTAYIGRGSGTCTLTLDGGVFAANNLTRDSGTGTLTFTMNGGTIKALESNTAFIASGVNITVDSNGGTIDTNGKAVTIASAITGTGTLTITGGGVAEFTTAPTCSVEVKEGTTVNVKAVHTVGGTSATSLTVSGGTFRSYEDIRVGDSAAGTINISGTSDNPAVVSCQGYKDGADVAKWIIFGTSGSADNAITLGEYGTLKAYRIQHYKAHTGKFEITFDGGTLTSLETGETIGDYWSGENGGAKIIVTSNGGTLDVGAFDATIEYSEVTGSGTLNKVGSGKLTFTETPAATVLFNLRAGTLVIPNGYAGTVTTDVASSQVVTTPGDGVNVYTLERAPAEYTWVGGASGNWSDVANWTVLQSGEQVAATAYPNVGDSVAFTSATSVTVDVADAGASSVSGNGYLTLVGGTGAVSLAIPSGIKVYADSTTAPNVTLKATASNGSGEFVYSAYPATLPTIDSSWTGVVELNGTYSGGSGALSLTTFGNANSTVRIGAQGFKLDSGSAAGGNFLTGDDLSANAVGTLEIVGTLSIGNRKQVIYNHYIIIPSKLTGTGKISCSLCGGSSYKTIRLLFTGDISGFSGSVQADVNSTYPAQVQFITTAGDPRSDANLVAHAANTIAIANGTTFTLASGQNFSVRSGGGLIVNGTLNLEGNSSSVNMLRGSGQVILGSYNASVGASFAANANWTGVVELPALAAPAANTTITKLGGNYYGNANSFVKLGNIAAGEYGYNFPATVTSKINITSSVATRGGSATTIPYVTGGGAFTAGTALHTITSLENYTGTLGTADGGSIAVDAVYVDSLADESSQVVATTSDCNFTGSAALYVGGVDTGKRLTKKDGGGLYIDAGVAVDSNGTPYDSVGEAIAAANASDEITGVTVNLDASEELTISKPLTITLSNGATLAATSLAITDDAALTLAGTGTFVIPQGMAFAGLTVGENVTMQVSGAIVTDTLLFSYTSGGFAVAPSTIGTALGNIHYTVGSSNGVTCITAGKKFYWRGADNASLSSTSWLADGDSEVGTEIPTVADTAIFDSTTKGYVAELNSNTTYGYHINVNDDITLKMASNAATYVGTLATATSLETKLTVADGKTVDIYMYGNTGWSNGLNLYSTLYGSGDIKFRVRQMNSYIFIYGNTSNFNGNVYEVLETYNGSTYQGTVINALSACDNSNSRWYISVDGKAIERGDKDDYTPFRYNGTYKFGVLQAWVKPSGASRTFELGEKINEDSWIRGKWHNTTPQSTIYWKAASSTLTLGIEKTESLVVANTGKVKILDAESTPSSITFSAAGSLILDDDNAEAADTIVGAIGTSTATPGLLKQGSGTITLTSVPSMKVSITVEAGELVTPNTLDHTLGAMTKKKDGENGTYVFYKATGIATDGTAEIPDVSSQEAADAIADGYVVTLTEAQEKQGLSADYYNVKATVKTGAENTYVLTPVLKDEVAPKVAEGVKVKGATVTIPVGNLKAGLRYRVAIGSAAGSLSSTAAWSAIYDGTEATEPTLTAELPSEGVLYYAIEASDTAQ